MIIDISPLVSERIAVWPGDVPYRRKASLEISKGANIDQKDEFGQTALSISLSVLTKDIGARRLQIPRRYREETAQLLLKLGAGTLDKTGVVVVLQRSGDLNLGNRAGQETSSGESPR